MRVLFTTPILEHPAAGGPQLRIENSIKALGKVCDLHIVSRVSKYDLGGQEIEDYYRQYCKDFRYAPSVVRKRYQIMRKMAGMTTEDADYIVNTVKKHKIDVVWFGYGNISYPLMMRVKEIMPALKMVCDTDSVWSRFVLRGLPYENDPERRAAIEKEGREKEAEEQAWVDMCEVTTAVSEVDAEYYKSLASDPARIHVFSNVIDLESYSVKAALPAGFRKPCVYLAGTFGPKSPMDKAARWVIEEVIPVVRNKIPDIHFYIVGRGSIETLHDVDDPGITIVGKVPTVLPYLCNADVALVSLFFESGTRFKILEAAACDIPIVSTTLGAEGIPVTDGHDIIIADDPEKFADGIVRIIADKKYGDGLAENCKRLIKAGYSVEALAIEAKTVLSYLEEL
jgi:polysaccharide biosynthesis protein PslH